MSFIVEVPNGGNTYWLAPWTGDPGRTFVRENAQQFGSEAVAAAAIALAKRRFGEHRPSLNAAFILPTP